MGRGVARWSRWVLLDKLWEQAESCCGWVVLQRYGPRNNAYQLVHQLRRQGVEIHTLHGLGYLLPQTRANHDLIAALLRRAELTRAARDQRLRLAALERAMRARINALGPPALLEVDHIE